MKRTKQRVNRVNQNEKKIIASWFTAEIRQDSQVCNPIYAEFTVTHSIKGGEGEKNIRYKRTNYLRNLK